MTIAFDRRLCICRGLAAWGPHRLSAQLTSSRNKVPACTDCFYCGPYPTLVPGVGFAVC